MAAGPETHAEPLPPAARAGGRSFSASWTRRALADPPNLAAAGLLLIGGALLYHWYSRLIPWRDEWGFLLHRRGWGISSFLDPDVEHLHAIPVLVYKVQESLFGLDSATFTHLVAVALFLACVALLFVYLRPRVGGWIAVAAILPLFFLGTSWDVLLFPFSMAVFGSMACGIAAFLLIERDDVVGDVAATVLLVVGLLFSDIGIPFVAGVFVNLVLTPGRFRRAYVFVVPTVLWLLWYAGWGHEAKTFVSFRNFANAPAYVFDGLATSVSGLLGLSAARTDTTPSPLDWGRPLLVLLIAFAAWRMSRLGRPSNRLLALLTVLIGFWFLTALDANPFAPATTGRYVFQAAMLLLMVAGELAVGLRARGWALATVFAVAFFAAFSNVYALRDNANALAGVAQQQRGALAALELTRGEVNPNFTLDVQNSGVDTLLTLSAGPYLSAADAYGSPAYTPAELATAPEAGQIAADKVFATGLGVSLKPAAAAGTACTSTSLKGSAVIRVPTGGAVLRAQGDGVQASLRRYSSDGFPVSLGALPAGQPTELRIPSDRSSVPWTLQLAGTGPVSVCRLTQG